MTIYSYVSTVPYNRKWIFVYLGTSWVIRKIPETVKKKNSRNMPEDITCQRFITCLRFIQKHARNMPQKIPETCPKKFQKHARNMPQKIPETCPKKFQKHARNMPQKIPETCPKHAQKNSRNMPEVAITSWICHCDVLSYKEEVIWLSNSIPFEMFHCCF